jgi:hypothetical protein
VMKACRMSGSVVNDMGFLSWVMGQATAMAGPAVGSGLVRLVQAA